MIVVALAVSCLYLLLMFWNSYTELYKQVTSQKSPHDKYNVIILHGDKETTQDLLTTIQTELLANSIQISKLFENLREREQIVNDHSFEKDINPDSWPGVFGNNESRVYAVVQKCTDKKCQHVNLTFRPTTENPQTPAEITVNQTASLTLTKTTTPEITANQTATLTLTKTTTPELTANQTETLTLTKITTPEITANQTVSLTLTKTKPCPVSDIKTKKQILNTKVQEKQSTTIWQYMKSLGLEEDVIFKYPRLILSFVSDRVTLPVVVISVYLLSGLIYCYLWKSTKHSYETIRREQNLPGIQKILTNMIKQLKTISDKQEKMNHLVMTSKYFEIIESMHERMEKIENNIITTEQSPEEVNILSRITEKNSIILQAVNNVTKFEKNKKLSLNEEREYIKLLYTTETFLLSEIVHKLWAADLQLEDYIDELETKEASLEYDDTVKVKIRGEIESMKRDRAYLLSFFEHPTLLVMMIGNKELADCLPSNFFDAHQV